MKFRRRNAPLVLLLVPFASALSAAAQDNMQSTLSKSADSLVSDPKTSPIADTTKSKFDIGTKDAPVDGKDGKPHAGPFVGTENDSKVKGSSTNSESLLGTKKEEVAKLVTPGGAKIPQVNDGVMNDPSRAPPKLGTTGTEGGVSEKDKVRKAQEGQTGEKIEKTPGSPKEAPSLSLSTDEKLKSEKSKLKDDGDAMVDSLGGLEVKRAILVSPMIWL